MRIDLFAAGLIVAVLPGACATRHSDRVDVSPLPLPDTPVFFSIAVESGGASLVCVVERAGRCDLERVDVESGRRQRLRSLPRCGAPLVALASGDLIVYDGPESLWMAHDGTEVVEAPRPVVAARDRNDVVQASNGGLLWRLGEDVVELPALQLAPRPRILRDGSGVVGVRSDGGSLFIARYARNEGASVLAGSFSEVESFDIAPDEKELVVSARRDRDASLDVAIVSMAGGALNWVFPDDRDERLVTWAPRGNKITFVLDAGDGSLVRTIHVPTSTALAIDQAGGRVESISWEPNAERFAMVWSAPDRSSGIDLIRYGGEDRRILVAPAIDGRWIVDRDPRLGVETFIVPPSPIRYDARYPLVVWLGIDEPLRFDAVRSWLYENGSFGMIVTNRNVEGVDEAFHQAIRELTWVDPSQVIFVASGPDDELELPEGSILVVPARKSTSEREAAGDVGVRQRIVTIDVPVNMSVDEAVGGFLSSHLRIDANGEN